jgi:hypothetical protein
MRARLLQEVSRDRGVKNSILEPPARKFDRLEQVRVELVVLHRIARLAWHGKKGISLV